ncbi:MAG TPA: hypothetical protein P5195_06965 [Anaerolineae bacterium]|nr:hypothetical protein [Anaerolineae bacterium]
MGDLPTRPHGLTAIGDIVRFELAHAPTVRGVHDGRVACGEGGGIFPSQKT